MMCGMGGGAQVDEGGEDEGEEEVVEKRNFIRNFSYI